VPLNHLPDVEANRMVDVLGIASHVGTRTDLTVGTHRERKGGGTCCVFRRDFPTAISIPPIPPVAQSKAGKALVKRDLTLADTSGSTVVCTLWGEKADMEVEAGSVVAVKGAKVGDFGGRSLSTTSSSLVNVNPADLPDAVKLAAW